MISVRPFLMAGAAVAGLAGVALAQSDGPGQRLALPIACQLGQTCDIQNYVDHDPGPGATDYRCGSRTYEAHSGVDFRLPNLAAQKRGVDVLAAADGKVLRVRDGAPDVSVRDRGQTAVQNQECGNGLVIEHAGGLTTQYCHMAQGSLVVKPGDQVKAGARLGRVGLSGNTEYPHLHFTVRQGDKVVDPFGAGPKAAGACAGGQSLWRPELARALAYKSTSVLNAGFADRAPDMAAIEAGDLRAPGASASVMIAYVRTIGPRAGDMETIKLMDPAGTVLAANMLPPLAKNQAQRFIYVGAKRPAAGWSKGAYRATYVLTREGKVVAERQFTTTATE